MADSNLVTQLNYGVQAAEVITTPIDDTLQISGVAADAKATGDAIKEVSDYMGSGTIPGGANSLLEALTDIITAIGNTALPVSTTTITGALSTIAGQIGDGVSGETLTDAITLIRQFIGDAELPEGATTVTEALNVILTAAVRSINDQTPDETGNVEISTGVMTVNGEEPDENGNINVETGLSRISVNGETPDENGEIDVPVGVKTINGEEPDENGNFDIEESEGLVHSVNGEEPDGEGNVTLNRVPFADDLYTEDTQEISGAFIARTSGGSASIADSTVIIKKIYGTSTRSGYVPTSREMSISWGERTEEPQITATIEWDTFIAHVGGETTTMDISYDGEDWDYDLDSCGITITGGTAVDGDVIHVEYVAEERGTITNAFPSAFKTTGWNLYNNATGYARVVMYSENYGYRIDGAYSTVKFCTEQGGTETDVVIDENGLFNISADGWLHVVGGNDTTTAIYTTWSDWANGTPNEFEAYTEHTILLTTAINSIFPGGMCSVGNVKDEFSPQDQAYIRRINRIEYSAANLASVIAGGTDYIYDTEYIYYVLAEPIRGTYTIDRSLPVSSHGLEIFNSETAISCVFVYTQALKDKLRRNVLTISAQELTDAQKAQVATNLGTVRYHDIHFEYMASSEIADLVDQIIAQMTEDGVYAFSGPWTMWRNGYDALCYRKVYDGDTIGWSGTVHAYAGSSWAFESRSGSAETTVIKLAEKNITLNNVATPGTGITINSQSAVANGHVISLRVSCKKTDGSVFSGRISPLFTIASEYITLRNINAVCVTCANVNSLMTGVAYAYIQTNGAVVVDVGTASQKEIIVDVCYLF